MRAHIGQGLMAVLALSLTSCPSIDSLLRIYGFTTLRPPSVLMAPGSIVSVTSTRPFSANIICTQSDALGSDFVPMQAPTQSAELKKSTEREFDVTAQYMEIVRADAKYNQIAQIVARLSNAMIYTISDVDVMRTLSKRNPLCTEAVHKRRAANYKLTMVRSALKADVTYNISFNRTAALSASAKIAVLHDLSLALGFKNANVTETTIAGENLFWGIVDDSFLAALPDTSTDSEKHLTQAFDEGLTVYESAEP